MAQATSISWTDLSWNPVTGCSHVSPGCEHCYAEALSLRFKRSAHPWGAQWARENIVLHPERLSQPGHWKQPKKIFVNSMSDLFHEQIPNEFILQVFIRMAANPRHTYQILTKRPEQALAFFGWWEDNQERIWYGDIGEALGNYFPLTFYKNPWPYVWIGASVEDQRRKARIDTLRQVPARIRFLSLEPLLEDLGELDLTGIDWVIVGGESGRGYRPMNPDWARSIRDQCQAAGVAFWYKQSGGLRPEMNPTLDGVTWHQFPEGHHA